MGERLTGLSRGLLMPILLMIAFAVYYLYYR
jgi:hypothetical protein